MKISGVYDMVEANYQEGKRHSESVREMNKRDLMKRFAVIPDGYWEIEQKAYDEMQKELEPFDFSTEVYVKKWAEFYGEELTEKEVNEVLKYYSSTIGQKDLAAQVRAAEKWNSFMAEGYESALEKAAKNYNATLNGFLKKYIESLKHQEAQ